MEAHNSGVFFFLFDNHTRQEGMPLVEAAEDASALLAAASEHFDHQVLTLTAERILQEFTDEKLSPRLKNTEGFDPELFKAVTMFELSHLQDESDMAQCVQYLSNLWAKPEMSDIGLEIIFTAPTKRAKYNPFTEYSEFITYSLIGEYVKYMPKPPAPEQDPLKEDIDGKQWRVMIGDRTLELSDHHPVLTRQLLKDLRKIFPRHIIDELEFRFPDQGEFNDIQPFIDRIKNERQKGKLPPADEILAGCQRERERLNKDFGVDREDEPITAEPMTAEEAVEVYKSQFRNINKRMDGDEVYLPEAKAWFTVWHMASEHEVNTYYRRIWHGDLTAPDDVPEVRPEEKAPIVAALQELLNTQQDKDDPFDDSVKWTIHDIYGPWDQVIDK